MRTKQRSHGTLVVAAFVGSLIAATACADDDGDSDTNGGGTGGGTQSSGGSQTAGEAGESGATAGANSGGAPGSGGTFGTGGTAGIGGDAGAGALGQAGDLGLGGNAAGAGGDAGAEGGSAGAPSAGSGGNADDREVFRPELREFSEELLEELTLPPGFEINVFASGVANARMLAVHGERVYVTRPLRGDVLRLVDEDADGSAESNEPVATDLMNVHGIAFKDDQVFLATDKRVFRGTVTETGDFEGLTAIIEDLPDGGQHPYRTLGVGDDDLLYVSIGSDCNACAETNPEHATMLRMALDGSMRGVFASGLRNTIGFGWHPDSGELWGMDHGTDWLGNDTPPEELNLLVLGGDYGWPYCYGKRAIDPVIDDPPDTTKEAYCANTLPSTLEHRAHGAPIGLAFYTGTAFPEEYRGDAFIALHGSWNRFPPTGYGVARITFDDGEPTGFEDFVSGFLIEDGTAQFGRPAGIAVAADGALLFSDDDNGVIYRVSHP